MTSTAGPRRRPRWRELRPMLPPVPTLPTTTTRLAQAADIGDLRVLARRRAPRMVFDYVDGGAESERSLRASVEAFDRVTFRPRVLRDVGTVSTSTDVLGRSIALPLVLGPTGFTRMMHRDGESAVARAAAAAGIPYTLSTMGTTTATDVAAAAPEGWNWFQLYVVRDRSRSRDSLQLARDAGMDVLVLTVDVPVAGARLRDVRHGMTMPPSLRWRSALQAVRRPAWWADFLTSEPLAFATVGGAPGDLAGIINTMFDPGVTLADIEWIRSAWGGKLLVKGVQDVVDAQSLAGIGVDGLVVSNHGGRQLDRAPAPLDLLPHVREAVGEEMAVFLDGGVRSGADIAAAVGLGATAAFIGRGYLYGLMAGGEAGVQRALTILRIEYERTMQLLGVTTTGELTDARVSLRS
ncbi:alpha-hydroxy acid oxidase [Modestobacter sp. VKM Ac-2979]|uniref:alpha-hydroxy acid oxidase n=1 Tax=unclassified Modestobacter TaxID=2643866 RepID=UPI0022ABB38A|nr:MULTISPECIES: alpha-hydroxy acid oxidase [unclassified Modestobacter]MCZ2811788.1 alpha-hydroxy acid oxidase [Modestobacter sp. VKM Ac-2979]MCZ2843511.1 alpha-hydroxy acid oxidase [Modestobacter sp. VKM Ac-2980]